MALIICFIGLIIFCCILYYQERVWRAEMESINEMFAKNCMEYFKQYTEANSRNIKEMDDE